MSVRFWAARALEKPILPCVQDDKPILCSLAMSLILRDEAFFVL